MGPIFYRHLENDKTTALRECKGHFSVIMTLSEESQQELQWWYDNIESADYKISEYLILRLTSPSALMLHMMAKFWVHQKQGVE